jgi:hypothetical protein
VALCVRQLRRQARGALALTVLPVKYARLLLALALLALLAVPIWLYPYVPLADYPNHLARMEILSLYDRSPSLQAIYIRDPRLLPDLGMDLIVPLLRQHFSLLTSGKLYLTALLVLYCTGTVALGTALLGRLSLRSVLLWPAFYNSTLLWGLINYVTGVCVFILWAALLVYTVSNDVRRPHPSRYALLLIGAVVCYVAHLTALAMCCVTWGMLVLRSLAVERRVAGPLLLCGTTLIIPLALYAYLFAAGHPGAIDPTPTSVHWAWGTKLTQLGLFTRGYHWREDVIPTLLLGGAFGYCWVRARSRPWLSTALWPAAGFFAAWLLLPQNANTDIWGVDLRFYWPAWLFLVFAVPVSGWGVREQAVLASAIFLAWGLRIAALSGNWRELSSSSAEMIALLDQLPEGARLYPVRGLDPNPDGEKRIMALAHVVEYEVVRRGIFDPALYTFPGGQPIVFRSRPHYRQQGLIEQMTDYDYVWSVEPRPEIRDYLHSHAVPLGEASGFVLWRLRKD